MGNKFWHHEGMNNVIANWSEFESKLFSTWKIGVLEKLYLCQRFLLPLLEFVLIHIPWLFISVKVDYLDSVALHEVLHENIIKYHKEVNGIKPSAGHLKENVLALLKPKVQGIYFCHYRRDSNYRLLIFIENELLDSIVSYNFLHKQHYPIL